MTETEMQKEGGTVDSLGIHFVNCIGALSLFLRGEECSEAAVEYARRAMVELLEKYKKRDNQEWDMCYCCIDAAIAQIPALSGSGREYAARRIQKQFEELYEFEGGCYEEQCLPQVFLTLLAKEIDA